MTSDRGISPAHVHPPHRGVSIAVSHPPRPEPPPESPCAETCHGCDRRVDRFIPTPIHTPPADPLRVEPAPPAVLDELAAPPTGRKAYAPDPVGTPLEPAETPPDPSERVEAIDFLQVTNLGTLLDLLA